jgi:hypothetical protein
MAIDAVFPTLSTPVQQNSISVSTDQPKLAESAGVKTQTENAVAPDEGSEGASGNELSQGNKDGRGQLVDIKV